MGQVSNFENNRRVKQALKNLALCVAVSLRIGLVKLTPQKHRMFYVKIPSISHSYACPRLTAKGLVYPLGLGSGVAITCLHFKTSTSVVPCSGLSGNILAESTLPTRV